MEKLLGAISAHEEPRGSIEHELPIPFGELGKRLKIPESTLQKLHRAGRGPHTFLIGRRLYCRPADLRAWFDKMADEA